MTKKTSNWLKVFTLFFFLLNSITDSYAQFDQKNLSHSPSPNSSSIVKYANTEVNLYTGVPSISSELHTLTARGYSVPISLYYTASGIKVQDVASSVGLGWTISTNCLVTRSVNGLPDEDPVNGYFGSNMGQKIAGVLSAQDLKDLSDNVKDSEPDIFYYNLNGTVGRFVFDKDKNPLLLENNGLMIINSPFKQELGVDGWIFRDAGGTKFYLGTSSNTKESTSSKAYFLNDSKTTVFDSSWYLEKIETPNQTEVVNFNYTSGSPVKVVHYSKKMKMRNKIVATIYREVKILWIRVQKASINSVIDVIDQEYWDSNLEEMVASPKYLTSVTSSDQSAFFSYSPNLRTDLDNGLALSKIEIKDHQGQLMKSFTLNQSFKESTDYQPSEVIPSQEKYRMMLNSVMLTTSANNSTPLYRYSYNPISLPPRNTSKTDAWGYYNSNPYGFFPSEDYAEAARDIDENRVKASSLEQITFASGGYKRFVFEGNKYYEYQSHSTNKAGGLRVTKILDVGGMDQPPKVSKYTYTYQGYEGKRLRPDPIYETMIDHPNLTVPYRVGTNVAPNSTVTLIPSSPAGPHSFVDPRGQLYAPSFTPLSPSIPYGGAAQFLFTQVGKIIAELKPSTLVMYSPFVISSSTPYNGLSDLEGASVGYSNVTVENSEGKTQTRFTDIDQFPDVATQIRVNSNYATTTILYTDIAPFSPFTSYAFARGRPENISYIKTDGTVGKRVEMKYTFGNINKSVLGLRCALGKVTPVGNNWAATDAYYNVGTYHYLSYALSAIETTEYELGHQVRKTTTYDSSYPYSIIGETFVNSDESVFSTEYKYVNQKDQVSYSNQSEIDGANALYATGRYGILLEKISKKGNLIISKETIGYNNWLINNKTLLLPKFSYSGNATINRIEQEFIEYDEFGNLLVSSGYLSPKTSTKWGYNNLYPVAKVVNATLNEMFFEDFEDSGSTNGEAYSGNKFHSGNYAVPFIIPNARTYQVSYWYRLNNVWKFSGLLPYTGPVTLNLGDAIDHVTIRPVDATIQTRSYDYFYGLIANTNSGAKVTSYTYDDFFRPKLVKDNNKNIINQYRYNDVSSPVGPVYFNVKRSEIYFKEGCPEGEVGAPLEYTVPAEKYFSYLSQADADAKAQAELDLKGQTYVNQNGACVAHADCSLTYRTDSGFGSASYTITKSFEDGKRVLCKLRARYDNLHGQTFEAMYDVQLEAHETEVSGSIMIGGGTWAELEIIEIILN